MFGITKGQPINYEAFLEEVPEEKIYAYVFQHIFKCRPPDTSSPISSPLPNREDPTPSFYLYQKNGKTKWKDHGYPRARGNNAISLYQEATGQSNFRKAMNELHAILAYNETIINPKMYLEMARVKEKKSTQAGFRYRRTWEPEQLAYWHRLGISEKVLTHFNVFPTRIAWLDWHVFHKSSVKDPMYVYFFSRQPESWQLYRPLTRTKKNKFRSHNTQDVIMGWDMLPQSGDLVIITSSYKDVMLFHTMGIPAIAKSSEGNAHLISDEKIKELKSRFTNTLVIMDNDQAGKDSVELMLNKWPYFKSWEVPVQYADCKDPSDVVEDELFGRNVLTALINNEWTKLLKIPFNLK